MGVLCIAVLLVFLLQVKLIAVSCFQIREDNDAKNHETRLCQALWWL